MVSENVAVSGRHTPGRWELSGPFGINDYDESEGFYRVSAKRMLFLTVARDTDGYVAGENEANARLIAAAPDLLAACEALVDRIKDGGSDAASSYMLDMARAAIARTKTGEGE